MATTLSITISKSRVIDEAQKASAYIGKKLTNEKDPGAYERIAALDADREQLDIYWMEACNDATLGMGHWLIAVTDQMLGHHYDHTRDYHVELSLPSNWNTNLAGPTKEAVMSYLVNSVAAAWFLTTGEGNAYAQAAAKAAGRLLLIVDNLMARVRPASRLAGGGSSGGGDGSGDGGGQCNCRQHVILTQEEYDNLTVIDEDTIYLIYEDV